jgi:hypothetical protein
MSVGGDMRVATNLTLRPGSDGNQLMQPKNTAGGGDPSRRRMQMMMMGGYTSLIVGRSLDVGLKAQLMPRSELLLWPEYARTTAYAATSNLRVGGYLSIEEEALAEVRGSVEVGTSPRRPSLLDLWKDACASCIWVPEPWSSVGYYQCPKDQD